MLLLYGKIKCKKLYNAITTNDKLTIANLIIKQANIDAKEFVAAITLSRFNLLK